MAIEPTKYPEWARVYEPNHPISNQPNIAEPSDTKKDSGFTFKERPPRQNFNWLFNLIDSWIKWFKQETDTNRNGIVTVNESLGLHVNDTDEAHQASAIGNNSDVTGANTAAALNNLNGRLSPITFIGNAEIVRVNAEIIMSLGSLWHGDYIDPYNINRCQYKQIGPDTCVINYNIHGRIIKTSPPSPYVNALEVNDSLTFPGLTTADQDGLALIYINGVMEVGVRLSYLSGSDWITAFWRLSGEFPDNTPIIIHATATGKIAA